MSMLNTKIESFSLSLRVRKLDIDESRCYDIVCPLCGSQSVIQLWEWKNHAYNHRRCGELDCKYGNGNS